MEWMSWTIPTAAFFVVIGLILVGMTTWELRSPSILRRGFLPIATTRGDRLFIGLLGSAYLHLLVIGVTDWSIWVGLRVVPGVAVGCDAVGLVESLGNVAPKLKQEVSMFDKNNKLRHSISLAADAGTQRFERRGLGRCL